MQIITSTKMFALNDVTNIVDDGTPNLTPNLSHTTTDQKNTTTGSVISHHNK